MNKLWRYVSLLQNAKKFKESIERHGINNYIGQENKSMGLDNVKKGDVLISDNAKLADRIVVEVVGDIVFSKSVDTDSVALFDEKSSLSRRYKIKKQEELKIIEAGTFYLTRAGDKAFVYCKYKDVHGDLCIRYLNLKSDEVISKYADGRDDSLTADGHGNDLRYDPLSDIVKLHPEQYF